MRKALTVATMLLTRVLVVILLGLASSSGEPATAVEVDETLVKSAEALNALLKLETKQWCSVIVITDGTASSYIIHKIIKELTPNYGIRLYESNYQATHQNETKPHLADIIMEVKKFKRSHECVSVVAYSDSIGFLDLLASAYQFDLFFVWKNRPIIVTSLTSKHITTLLQRHWTLFAGNAKVIQVVNSQGSNSLMILTHLSYGPEEGGQLIQVATWSKYRGMRATPYNASVPAAYWEHMTVKDALNDPWTLSRLLHDPKSFRFKAPVQATVATTEWDAQVTVRKDENDKIVIGGPMAKLVYSVAKSMNFTIKLIEPADGQWGSINPDGSWTGLVGQVHRHEADFTIGPHEVTEVRINHIDFTIPLVFDARKLVVAQRKAQVDPWGFLYPLSPFVWLLTGFSLCAVALLSIVVGGNYKKEPLHLYVYAVAFHTYRLFLQQGLTMKLLRTSERLLITSWLLASMIIYWSYNTSLISLLAVRYAPRPIQTIRDFLDHDNMIVIFAYRTALSDYLFSVESGQLKEMADLSKIGRYTEKPWWEFYQVLETHVSKGTHVLATDTINSGQLIAKYFSNKGVCQFYRARETFVPYMLAMVFQKGSPLVPAVDARIQALFEAGIYQYWLEKNVANSTACKKMPSTYTVREPLAFANIWGVFVFLLGGLTVGGAALFLEVLFAKIQ